MTDVPGQPLYTEAIWGRPGADLGFVVSRVQAQPWPTLSSGDLRRYRPPRPPGMMTLLPEGSVQLRPWEPPPGQSRAWGAFRPRGAAGPERGRARWTSQHVARVWISPQQRLRLQSDKRPITALVPQYGGSFPPQHRVPHSPHPAAHRSSQQPRDQQAGPMRKQTQRERRPCPRPTVTTGQLHTPVLTLRHLQPRICECCRQRS